MPKKIVRTHFPEFALVNGCFTFTNSHFGSVKYQITRAQYDKIKREGFVKVFFRSGGLTSPTPRQTELFLSKNAEAVHLGPGVVTQGGIRLPELSCEVFAVRYLAEAALSPTDYAPDSTPLSDSELIVKAAALPHRFMTCEHAFNLVSGSTYARLALTRRDPYRLIACATPAGKPFPSKLGGVLHKLFGLRVEFILHCYAPEATAFYALAPVEAAELDAPPLDLAPYLSAFKEDHERLWRAFWRAFSNYPYPTVEQDEFGDLVLTSRGAKRFSSVEQALSHAASKLAV